MACSQIPPDLADDLRVHLATLYQPGLGPRLVETFGSAREALRQASGTLGSVPGMTAAALARLRDPTLARAAVDELRRARDAGARILVRGRTPYPPALLPLAGMPLVLYLRGDLSLLVPPGDAETAPAAGLVGSRRPTPYGARQARAFASGLAARGITVVSGLARGIDGEAHRSCLEAGGATVGVLGSGLSRPYPVEHRDLARRMAESGAGAVVTEFPFAASPRSFHFPMRNRILSGLCEGIVVVEAGDRSGSLITARHALDQGKTVYVVPGRISAEALGGLRLLYDGATPALDARDVLPGRGRDPGGRSGGRGEDAAPPPLDGPFAARLEDLFREEDAWHADRIAQRLGVDASAILAELARLEIEGRLERVPGGSYARGRRR